jgi:hypothetical protein
MDKSEHASLKKSLDQLEVDLIRFKQILRMESETTSPTPAAPPKGPAAAASSSASEGRRTAAAAVIRRRHGTASAATRVRYRGGGFL